MPADVCDLDRTYAERARKIAAEAAALQLTDHMLQGEVVRLIAPDYRMANRFAELFAEFREMYVPERKRREAATFDSALPQEAHNL